MIWKLFHKGWTCKHLYDDGPGIPVRLPDDAMLREKRSEDAAGGLNISWFEGHDYLYRNVLTLSENEANQHHVLEFEGVYRKAEVMINGQRAAFRPYGYIGYYVDCDKYFHTGENTIEVIARNADQPNSRWYTGAGIYRPVRLWSSGHQFIEPNGVRITPLSLAPARVRVDITTSGEGPVRVELLDSVIVSNGVITSAVKQVPDEDSASEGENKPGVANVSDGVITSAVEQGTDKNCTSDGEKNPDAGNGSDDVLISDGELVPECLNSANSENDSEGQKYVNGIEKACANYVARKNEAILAYVEGEGRSFEMEIPDAVLWSPENPHLYICRVYYMDDVAEESFGVRTISWGKDGFLINGRRVILRGACIHHDNGLTGAACLPEAVERRIRLLQENGYNAIRSAHNPCSRTALEICDRLGMLVLDEYADMWYIHKTQYDYAEDLEQWWQQDLCDIVRKDYNHPCVVMYSIGNEVAETAQKKGIALTREMTEHLHSLDPTRPVTCGVNLFFNFLSAVGFGQYSDKKAAREAERNAGMKGKTSDSKMEREAERNAGMKGKTSDSKTTVEVERNAGTMEDHLDSKGTLEAAGEALRNATGEEKCDSGITKQNSASKNKKRRKKAVGSEFFNNLAGLLGAGFMKRGAKLLGSDITTREAFSVMDIAGYNYGEKRYEKDLKKYPDRLILGSETFCSDAYRFWELAQKEPRLIGDFVWAGTDYLGEVMLGAWEYPDYAPDFDKGPGWISAGSGRIDLTGKPLGEAYYTRVALDREKGPYITVRPICHEGKHSPSAWKMTNSMRSWSFRGWEGKNAQIEVYARCASLELKLNGRSIRRKNADGKDCIFRFKVPYENGVLEAIAYDDSGAEIGRDQLVSAGEETVLRLEPESDAQPEMKSDTQPKLESDANTPAKTSETGNLMLKPELSAAEEGRLIYIRIRLTDRNGITKVTERSEIRLTVEGGRLIACGSACPYYERSYLSDTCETYYGEALAIIETKGEAVTIKAESRFGQEEMKIGTAV